MKRNAIISLQKKKGIAYAHNEQKELEKITHTNEKMYENY